MRNPLRQLPRHAGPKMTLRERAAALKATAARLIRGGRGVHVTDQPQSASLPEGTAADGSARSFSASEQVIHDAHRGRSDDLGRAYTAVGPAPHQEHAMGRHETFEHAVPLVEDLLGSTILQRSDPVFAAIEAHLAAERAVDEAYAATDTAATAEEEERAEAAASTSDRVEMEAWIALLQVRPSTMAGLSSLILHVARSAREHADRDGPSLQDVFAAINTAALGVVHQGAEVGPVDWCSPPEGSMATPAFTPRSFTGSADIANPDAKLIALGHRFDEAHAVWMALVPASNAAHDRIQTFKERAKEEGMDVISACQAAWLQEGVNEAHEAELAAFEALEPLHRAIMALPAHTVAGLAVKARSATLGPWASGTYEEDRQKGESEDWGKRLVRDLIDACTTRARREAVGGRHWHGRIEQPGKDLPDGTVLYEDITGRLVRRPMEDWIGYMVQRMYSVARQELNRRFNAECGNLNQDACEALHSKLQRDLRLDALKDAAFRSAEVFKVAEAKRRGEDPREPPAPDDVLRHFDLGTIPLRELHTMGRHAEALRHMACGLESMPSSTWGNEEGVLNHSGRFAEWVADMGGTVMDACQKEIAGRAVDPGDMDGHLAIVASHVIAYGDADQQRALARDLFTLADRS